MAKEKNEALGELEDQDAVAWRLRAVVLLCGAGLMGLEMAGVRLLEPHFGSTIYVWGSIIGIFLGALSLGYWLGGLAADRRPRFDVLGYIILLAGVLILLIPLVANPLCLALAKTRGMDPRLRAVLGSFLLYAAPSVLLGMVSPFAVRLAARRVQTMGSVAGSLYAISTFGSILGTFLVAFVLTEFLGSKTTVWSIAVALILVSGLCFLRRWRGRPAAALLLAGLVAVPGYLGAREPDFIAIRRPRTPGAKVAHDGYPLDDRLLEVRESAYHQIAMLDSRSYLDPARYARYMLFNNQIESGIYLDENRAIPPGPIESACSYTRMLHLGVLFTQRGPCDALVIGAGGGIVPRTLVADYPDTIRRVDVVDIDALVFELARAYFRYPEAGAHPLIRSHVEDGRLFVQRSKARWDYVVLDAYTAGGRIPRHLISREFFALVGEHLAGEGVVVVNVISAMSGEHSRLFRSVYKTMRAVFPDVYAFPKRRRQYAENIILVGLSWKAGLGSADVMRRFADLDGTLLKRPRLREVVEGVKTVAPAMDDVPLLTDDFCPTDSMVYE